jgi:hypothetical protein
MILGAFLAGFIGSLSTPVLGLDDTGDIVIEVHWDQPNVCWEQLMAVMIIKLMEILLIVILIIFV